MSSAQVVSIEKGLSQDANSVLGKVQLILEAFEIDDDDLSLTELARRTRISKASVHRLAQELLAWGMLERSGRQYRLGMRAFELGSRVPRFRMLRDAARPIMENLYFSLRDAVHLAVLDGQEVLYLEKIAGSVQAARPSRIAGRMPLHCTATGKVLMAYAPSTLLEQVLQGNLERMTPATIIAPGLLAEQVRKASKTGYAVEREETVAGYCSVAVPVFGANQRTLGALSVTAPTFRADIPKYVKALSSASARLSSSPLINAARG